jgi:hypothetical protein
LWRGQLSEGRDAVNTRSPLFRALPYGLQRPVSIHCNSGFSGMIQMMPVTM